MHFVTVSDLNDSAFAAQEKRIKKAVDKMAVSILEWFPTGELDAESPRGIIVAADISKNDGPPIAVELNQATASRRSGFRIWRIRMEVYIGKPEKVHISPGPAIAGVDIYVITAHGEMAGRRVAPNGDSYVA
jgi:hypothetical protein